MACLPLKVVQSAAERTPAEEPEEVADEITGVVPPEEDRGYTAPTEVTVPLPLLLNVVQSVEERHPACEPDAVWQPSEPEEPICVNEPVRGDAGVRVEVATSPNKAGVALLEVQYAIPPAVS